MALVKIKLPFPSSYSSPSFSSSPHFSTKPNSIKSHSHPIYYTSSSSSPFTEKHSLERYRRDGWLYNGGRFEENASSYSLPSDSNSIRETDIAQQLPELRKLLQVLRTERRNVGGSDSDGSSREGPGNVFLVGTGPGDPELLTLKAVRVIEGADLLLYDRLVSNDVLNLVGPDARFLYVGKTAGYHSRTQVVNAFSLSL